MARLIGGVLSKGSGRLGGHVLAISAGQQIIREYQPNVGNPRTSLQRMQRTKVVLAGKLSQITPNDVIIGLGASKRDRRSEFTRNIIKNAHIFDLYGKYQAVLPPQKLVFSKGKYEGGVSAKMGEMTATNVSVAPMWESNVDAAIAVAVVYNAKSARYDFVGWAFSNESGANLDISLSNVTPGSTANIYVIPLVRKVSGGSVTSSGVYDEKNGYLGELQVGSPDAYEHRESIFIGFASLN